MYVQNHVCLSNLSDDQAWLISIADKSMSVTSDLLCDIFIFIYFPKALAAGSSFQWLLSFILAFVMCTGSSPARSTPLFSSSGLFDAYKTLHFPCFLFFSCQTMGSHHTSRTSRVFSMRFRGRSDHFRCDTAAAPIIFIVVSHLFW